MKHAAKRMILTSPGKPKRSVVIVRPPWPELGAKTLIDGDVYTVAELRDETVLFSVSFPKKKAAREAAEGQSKREPRPQGGQQKEES